MTDVIMSQSVAQPKSVKFIVAIAPQSRYRALYLNGMTVKHTEIAQLDMLVGRLVLNLLNIF